MRVEPRGNHDQARLEPLDLRDDLPFEGLYQFLVPRVRLERQVQGESGASTRPPLHSPARAGKTERGVLVEAAVIRQRIPLEDLLGSVAMMDVPVQDEDSLHAVDRPGVDGSDRDVVDEAKTHRRTPSRMMTRGPDGAE